MAATRKVDVSFAVLLNFDAAFTQTSTDLLLMVMHVNLIFKVRNKLDNAFEITFISFNTFICSANYKKKKRKHVFSSRTDEYPVSPVMINGQGEYLDPFYDRRRHRFVSLGTNCVSIIYTANTDCNSQMFYQMHREKISTKFFLCCNLFRSTESVDY